jgi:hypothetical protein
MSPGGRHAFVLGLILGTHVFLAYFFEHSVLTFRSNTHPQDLPDLSVTFIQGPRQLTLRSKNGRRTSKALRASSNTLSLPSQEVPPLRADDQSSPSSITDWHSEAHAAADNTLEHEQQQARERAFARTPAGSNVADSPGVFGSEQQNHRTGKVEDGTRVWVTDNCYFEVPRGGPPPRMAGEFHLLTRICKPPSTGGGDKMFEEMKPDSLKTLPILPSH